MLISGDLYLSVSCVLGRSDYLTSPDGGSIQLHVANRAQSPIAAGFYEVIEALREDIIF